MAQLHLEFPREAEHFTASRRHHGFGDLPRFVTGENPVDPIDMAERRAFQAILLPPFIAVVDLSA